MLSLLKSWDSIFNGTICERLEFKLNYGEFGIPHYVAFQCNRTGQWALLTPKKVILRSFLLTKAVMCEVPLTQKHSKQLNKEKL